MAIFLLVVGLILFVGLVVVHEFGHLLAARRGGVEVEEFGIGFPPRAWSKKLKSGMLFTLNWLPLGGFVKLKGEHDSATAKGSFGAASLTTKIQVMLAGVVMNLLTAFALLTVLALVGMPKIIENQFTVKSDTKVVNSQVLAGYIEPGSPADKAKLELRDRLVSISDGSKTVQIDSIPALQNGTEQFSGKKIELNITRDGKEQSISTVLRSREEVNASKKTDQPKGYLGVVLNELTVQRSTWSSPIVAVGLIKQLTVETFKGLGNALWNAIRGQGKAASQQVSGPVGIFVLLKDGSGLGYQYMLMIIAIISLTLAIMNVLPIPALDGGRLFVTLLYRKVLREPLSQDKEEQIHGTGFALLMLLFVVITVVDVRRFF